MDKMGWKPNETKYQKPNKIEITVEGGLVQDVDGIPDDVEVWINDYDTDGEKDEDLFTDKNGDKCHRFKW